MPSPRQVWIGFQQNRASFSAPGFTREVPPSAKPPLCSLSRRPGRPPLHQEQSSSVFSGFHVDEDIRLLLDSGVKRVCLGASEPPTQ